MFRRMTIAPQTALALGQDERRLDPVVDIALTTAGRILSQNDPAAVQTSALIRRIIVAPPPPWSGWFGGAKEKKSVAKVSDLNPALEKVATAREQPWLLPLTVLGALAGTFLLGRVTAGRQRTA